jgi:peptidoglycan/xylan/chitin deacetylase (PgdA/CDA1 family)
MRFLVLCYHRILPGGHITPENFARQLRELQKSYRCITLDKLLDSFLQPPLHNANYFAVTFDDGWRDNYVYAWPILKELGLKATIFLSTSLVRPENDRDGVNDPPAWRPSLGLAAREVIQMGFSPEFLSWREIREMHHSGVFDFQSHGHSHWRHLCGATVLRGHGRERYRDYENWLPELWNGSLSLAGPVLEHCGCLAHPRYFPPNQTAKTNQNRVGIRGDCLGAPAVNAKHPGDYYGRWESEAEFLERVGQDLETSRRLIWEHLGVTPTLLAWPFGEYSPLSLEAARSSGFRACFTTRLGVVRPGQDPWSLPRFSPPASRWWLRVATSSPFGMQVYKMAVRCLAWKQSMVRRMKPSKPYLPVYRR